ncbi:hypothetical protein HDN1F_35150 [gamma proteobacterium HdN1]|nr:Hypothetical protein HDN1F_18030 [gamma proteobacterium HdN1]CBL47098.1 hypothetical protein HDN1F_35150 [gamma proteobacterium HdN1]
MLSGSQAMVAAPVSQTVPVSGANIVDLIKVGLTGISGGCLNYCITGICVHYNGLKVIISPRIAHNTSEFTVSSFRAQGQQPWIEWKRVFGNIQASLANGIFGTLLGTGQIGGYGTYTEEHKENDRQLPFKEVDINGHPLALLPMLLGSGGMTAGGATQPPTEADFTEAQTAAGSMVDASDFAAMFMNSEILDVFSYMNTMNQIGTMASEMSEVMDYLSSMQDLASGMGGSGSYDLLCESTVTPFIPFYLSAIDTLTWRLPWPDVLTHSVDLAYGMTPFLPNRKVIGTPDAMPTLTNGVWAGLYPRIGFVNQEHDGKVGAVASQRALDLVLAEDGNDHFGHVTLFNPGFANQRDWHIIPYEFHASGVKGGVWQQVHPIPKAECRPSLYRDRELSDTAEDHSAPVVLGGDQNYIWAFWRRYECCMNRKGVFIGAIPTPDICLF